MTCKEFFKGKAFKCILVLTLVLLVSGVLLAVCWGFLEVTDEEMEARKFKVIYGTETVTPEDKEVENKKVGDATIEKVWYIKEKNDYVVQASSKGYGGDIVCWIAFEMQAENTQVKGIRKVIKYEVKDAAELIGYIGGEIYDKFSTDYTEGKVFTYGTKGDPEFIGTGASSSLTAICNCVNGSVTFIKAYAGGGTVVDPFEGLVETKFISSQTTWEVKDGSVEYHITTKANDGPSSFKIDITVNADKTISYYKITADGCEPSSEHTAEDYQNNMTAEAKDLTGKTLADIDGYLADDAEGGKLHTGATRSNELCYHAAKFALANYDAVIAKEANDEQV